METEPKCYRAELLRLGFDIKAVDEAVRARDAGLFILEPPSVLIERIMSVCCLLLLERRRKESLSEGGDKQ